MNLYFLLFFLPFLPLSGVGSIDQDLPGEIEEAISYEDELYLLNTFISQIEKTLAQAKEIRQEVKSYQVVQRKVARNSEDRDLVIQMVRAAEKILDRVQQNHLEHTFSPEFIRELSMFSKVAKNRSPKASL